MLNAFAEFLPNSSGYSRDGPIRRIYSEFGSVTDKTFVFIKNDNAIDFVGRFRLRRFGDPFFFRFLFLDRTCGMFVVFYCRVPRLRRRQTVFLRRVRPSAPLPNNETVAEGSFRTSGWITGRRSVRYKGPLPNNNQSGLTFGNRCNIFSMNSKLGLFRPPRM